MRTCSVCHNELPDSKFYTYFHSTQKKVRTRRECNNCFYSKRKIAKANKKLLEEASIQIKQVPQEEKIIQPEAPELKWDPSIPRKQCFKCKETFPATYEYFYKDHNRKGGYDGICRPCRKEYWKEKDEKDKEDEWGGSERIPVIPGTYADDEQKDFIFKFLPKLGWIYNKPTNTWYKPGVKDENNIWVGIKNKTKKTKNSCAYVTVDNERVIINENIINDMVKLYVSGNYTYKAISERYKTNASNVQLWVKKAITNIINLEQ